MTSKTVKLAMFGVLSAFTVSTFFVVLLSFRVSDLERQVNMLKEQDKLSNSIAEKHNNLLIDIIDILKQSNQQ